MKVGRNTWLLHLFRSRVLSTRTPRLGPLRAWGTTLAIPFPGRHLQADGKVPEHFSFPSLPLTYCRDLASGPLIKKGPW